MKALAVLLALLAGGGAFAEGLRAYREGRFAEALRAFAEAERTAGSDVPAELLYNKALAALCAGELVEAEAAAEKAAALGREPQFRALRDFVLGNAAFARCEQAATLADRPEAEPFLFDAAIVQAEAAQRHWQRAALSRPDWPEARRNVERALRKLDELREKKTEAEDKKKSEQPEEPPPPPPEPEPQPDEADPPEEEEVTPEMQREPLALSAEEIELLLEKLDQKEQEKLALRRERRRVETADVEKDW